MMSFCEMISLVDVRVDILYIKIKKAFDTVSQGIFKDKLMKSELKKTDRKVAEQQAQKSDWWQSPVTGQSLVVSTIKMCH